MTCHTCNKNGFKNISEMMVHIRGEHPDRYKRAKYNLPQMQGRRRGRPPKQEEVPMVTLKGDGPELSLREAIEALKIKRDALNEVIGDLEAML